MKNLYAHPPALLQKSFFTIMIMCACLLAAAQDIHFSQFQHSPANLNPALTGVFGGDLRFTGNYRSQWQSVPVPYKTFSGAFDAKLHHKFFGKNAYIGWGFHLNRDAAGDAEIGLSEIAASLAYTRRLNGRLFLTLGVQLKAAQRSVQPEKLSYAEQWNGDVYDPGRSSQEAFGESSRGLAGVSTGLNFHYQVEDSRTKLDFGFGLFHLNQPATGFLDDLDASLPLKGASYLACNFQAREKWDVRACASFHKQVTYTELVAGAAVRRHLNLEKNKELAVQAGIYLRPGDAWIPAAELQFRNWEAGVSYDVNYSPFKTASLRRGGVEFFIHHIIWKVQAPKEFKACPVF